MSLCRVCFLGCSKGVSKPVQVLFKGTEAGIELDFDDSEMGVSKSQGP